MTTSVSIECWSDVPDAVRSSRNHDNLMCELAYRDANPPADDEWTDFWTDLLDHPTNLVPYADDGIDVPDAERDELDRLALVGDDGRDADGELMEERAEPHTRKVA